MVALAAATIIGAAGCKGSDEHFSSAEASNAIAALDQIERNVDAGRCTAAQRRINALEIQATHVSSDRPQLGDAYSSSVVRLQQLVDRECVEIKPESPTPAVTPATGPTGGEHKPPKEPTDGGTEPTGGGQGQGGGNQGGGNQGGENQGGQNQGGNNQGGQNQGGNNQGGGNDGSNNSGGAAPGA